jgi:hypothetical protein
MDSGRQWVQFGQGSSGLQLEKQPQQYLQVTESLFDNPKFIQAGFHISWFIMTAIDTKVDQQTSSCFIKIWSLF